VASAQGFSTDGFYLKGFGGASFAQDEDLDAESDFDEWVGEDGIPFRADPEADASYDTGYLLGAAVGYRITPSVAAELEYAYRRAEGEFGLGLAVDGGDDIAFDPQNGDVTVNALMANAVYSFDPFGAGMAWRPYVGAGLGSAWLDFDGDSADAAFAYQVTGGLSYQVDPSWSLFGEARWFSTDGGEFVDSLFRVSGGYESFDLLLGASFGF
jgi:opacity protein-like surface antigen